MSILKFVRDTPKSLQEMYEYMIDKNKTTFDNCFAIGCSVYSAVNEMQFIKNIYHKDYLHPYIQVIFVFDIGINLDFYVIKRICEKIGYALLEDKRQIFAAIHYNDEEELRIHCHYMINSVGINGNLYKVMHYLSYYEKVNEILVPYGLKPIKMY